ncbi:MAG: WG repeat-containing protein, partial [Bacteroidia bacterium]|nr:WG repeat-containing protein [Bacteroidia bacterium]
MKKTVTLVILVFVIALAAVGYLFKDELMSLNPFFKNDLYFSFKENNKDRWGIMNFKGEIIVDSEWDEEPSISNDGIARVKDKKGNFQFFTIEKNPKQIGDDYKFAGDFSDGLAAVVKEGEGIE